jgi:surface protein
MSYIRKRNGVNHLLLAKHNGVEKRLLDKRNGVSNAQFIMDITTTSSPQTYTPRLVAEGADADYHFSIDWGDGSSEETYDNETGCNHEYATAGTYTIKIRGKFRGFAQANTGDKTLPVDVKQWGVFEPIKNSNCSTFDGCSNLVVTATDIMDGFAGTTYMTYMFRNTAVTTIANIGDWDVSSTTLFVAVFQGSDFQSDVSNWDVGNATSFENCFYQCANFNSDISGWDTSSATSMRYMLAECAIFNQDLSDWDVSGVTTMEAMFYKCSAFNNGGQALSTYTGGTPTGWNTTALTKITNMFRESAINVDVSGLDLNGVTNSTNVFNDATSFNQDIDDWDMSTVTSLASWFYGATAFNNGGSALTSWDVSSVASCYYCFAGCTSFNADIGGWDLSSCTNFTQMFGSATIFNQDISDWTLNSTSSVTMYQMFYAAVAFNQDISPWDMSKVNNIYMLMYGATAFNNGGVALDWADTSEVADWRYAFGGVNTTVSCKINVDMSSLDTSGATTMLGMFARNTSFNQDVSDWDVSGVTTFRQMFDQCTAFNNGGAALSDYNGGGSVLGWVTTAATGDAFYSTFYSCTSFNADISGFDMNGVTSCFRMFFGAVAFNCGGNSEMDNWDMSTVTNMDSMFQNADALNIDIGSWNTLLVSVFNNCFNGADIFNQDISTWDWSSVASLNSFVANTALSTANYDLLLQAWDSEPISGITITSSSLTYTSGGDGGTARTSLINDHSCSISGDSAA